MISKKGTNENILFDSLIKYIIPFFNDKKIKDKKKSKLEELVKKEKTITKPLELVLLEEMMNSILKIDDVKIKSEIEERDISEFIEFQKNEDKNKKVITGYSITAERKKENKDNSGYSISIQYEQTEIKESLKVTITFDNETINNYSANNNSINKNRLNEPKKEYSFAVTKEKENKTGDNYSVSIIYENNYEQERLSIDYKSTIGTYLNRRIESMHDFTDRVPGKNLETFPVAGNEGLYGYTFLGEVKAWRRDDLFGDFAKMVDVHECIHTPDEYETRILTDWIMSKPTTKYIK